MATAFISGPLDLTEEEFQTHYVPRIDHAIISNHWFVMGNAPGADTMALEHIIDTKLVSLDDIQVYCYGRHGLVEGGDSYHYKSKYNVGYTTSKLWTRPEHRDRECTDASMYDILWERPALTEEEGRAKYGVKYNPTRVSGTTLNRMRREQQQTKMTGIEVSAKVRVQDEVKE
jgi:hypothetical protein